MTQALINSLNIIPEKSVKVAEKMPKTEGLDFGKIFETKTDVQDKCSEQQTKMSDKKTVDTIALLNPTDKTESTTDSNTQTNTTDKIPTILPADTNIQSIEDTEENIILEEELLTLIDELITDETSNTEDSTDEDTNNEDTITEEEIPTMYNELNALEDPTAVLLLHSQIQKNVRPVLENDETEDSELTMNLKTSDKQTNSNTNSTAIFKQFESSNTKDISLVNITPKENIHVKQDVSKPSSVISENIVKELNVELLSSESAQSEGSMSDLMQNQSPQEQVTRVMIQGDIKYETVETKTAEATAQLKTAVSTPSKIVEQISKQLEGMINNSKLNMVLNPGTLGKVNLQLINTKEGLMAQFTVTTQDAKDLLLKGLDGLKESLLAQGVSVDSLSIKLEETDSENQFDWTEQEGSKGGNKQQQARKQKENEKDFEQMMFDIENENNV